MSGLHHNERRDYIRMEMDAPLSFTREGAPGTHTGRCIDMSHTGMRIETGTPLSPGERITVDLDLGNPKFNPMRARLEVMRVVEHPDGTATVSCRTLEIV